MNDSINPKWCSLSYISVELRYPGDRKWLGMEINGQVYIDGMLTFGLRSAPKLFNALADALEWCVAQEGVDSVFHYLDDFAVVGPPNSEACAQYLHTLVRVRNDLGVPLAPEKQEGPTSVITFLGIIIDTERGELRLPDDKLHHLIVAVTTWEK